MKSAALSQLKPFALVTAGMVSLALAGPVSELLDAWYSGSGYVTFALPGRTWSAETFMALWLGMRAAYAVALAAMVMGAWLLARRQPQRAIGRAYLAGGGLIAATVYVASRFLLSA